jgi:hypothetical protein
VEPDRRLRVGSAFRGTEVDHREFKVWPAVDPRLAESILYVIAYETVAVAFAACEIFGFTLELPPWISSELFRLKEAAELVALEREDG